MNISLNKGEHKALLRVTDNLMSMVTWNGVSQEQNITGVRTEELESNMEAYALLRRLSSIMQSNGYKLSEK